MGNDKCLLLIFLTDLYLTYKLSFLQRVVELRFDDLLRTSSNDSFPFKWMTVLFI
jgi:hypothetical protein